MLTDPTIKGRVAIVTGGGQGIGRSIALALARSGANVAILARRDNVFDVAKEIDALGVEGFGVQCDVSDSSSVNSAVAKVLEKFKKVDILVNCAGIFPLNPFTEMTEEEGDRVIDINLKGPFNCCKAVVPNMIENNYGRIVNIASVTGSGSVVPGQAHYGASKTGVIGFTRLLAMELKDHNIRVNAIAPGAFVSPGAFPSAPPDWFLATLPLGRAAECDEIAGAALLLAGEGASFIVGECIFVDGGHVIS